MKDESSHNRENLINPHSDLFACHCSDILRVTKGYLYGNCGRTFWEREMAESICIEPGLCLVDTLTCIHMHSRLVPIVVVVMLSKLVLPWIH